MVDDGKAEAQGSLNLKLPESGISLQERYSAESPINVPPAAVDVLANKKEIIAGFELLSHLDATQDRVKIRSQIDRTTAEVLVPLWGQLMKRNVWDLDPEINSQRNVIIDNAYAFNKTDGFKLINSAVVEDFAFRFSKNAELDNVLAVSDFAFGGAPARYSKIDKSDVCENPTIYNSAMWGREIGKYLNGGRFVKDVIGGVGVFAESFGLQFQKTYIVTPDGTYFLENVSFAPNERFRLDEKWRVTAK